MPGIASTNRRFAFIRTAALFALLYCILLWVAMEWTTEWGEVIRQWRHEYYGDAGEPNGSMKFRTPEGHLFKCFALPWGLLVYPLAAFGIIYFVRTAIMSSSTPSRCFSVFATVLLAAILCRFVWLGVFSAIAASL